LGFAVTPKDRQAGGPRWSLIRPQLIVTVLLVMAAVVGIARLAAGLSEPIGTLVNVIWVVFDIVIMSILVRAVLYQGFQPAGPGSEADPLVTDDRSALERKHNGA
jgi:cellulose synthase (UDP-forming)